MPLPQSVSRGVTIGWHNPFTHCSPAAQSASLVQAGGWVVAVAHAPLVHCSPLAQSASLVQAGGLVVVVVPGAHAPVIQTCEVGQSASAVQAQAGPTTGVDP